MQNQTIIRLETHPVLMNILEPDYKFSRDFPEGVAEMRRIMDASPDPLFIIDDVSQAQFSLDDLINAANQGCRGETPLWHHPKMLGIYFITQSKTIEMAVGGITSSTFGKVHARVCHSLDEALKDIDQVLERQP